MILLTPDTKIVDFRLQTRTAHHRTLACQLDDRDALRPLEGVSYYRLTLPAELRAIDSTAAERGTHC
jgi:hypothetical protein